MTPEEPGPGVGGARSPRVRSPSCSEGGGCGCGCGCRRGWGGPLLSGMGRRSCQSTVGGRPPPFHRWTSRPSAALGDSGPVPPARSAASGPAPHGPRPSSQHLRDRGSRPRPGGPLSGAWASFDWQGLGPPCPACLLPGPRLPGRSGLSLGLPPGSAWACPPAPLGASECQGPRPEGPPGPGHWVPTTTQAMWGHGPRVEGAPVPSQAPVPSGRKRRPQPAPSPGPGGSVVHRVPRGWERGAAAGTSGGGPPGALLRGRRGRPGGGRSSGPPLSGPGPPQDPSSGLLRGTVSCS